MTLVTCRRGFIPQPWQKLKLVSVLNLNCGVLRWNRCVGLADLARRAGVLRLIVNGSFATDTFEPNDVDCVLLIGTGFPRDVVAESEILAGLPFLELSLVDQEDFDVLVQRVFATDRNLATKGMLEVRG